MWIKQLGLCYKEKTYVNYEKETDNPHRGTHCCLYCHVVRTRESSHRQSMSKPSASFDLTENSGEKRGVRTACGTWTSRSSRLCGLGSPKSHRSLTSLHSLTGTGEVSLSRSVGEPPENNLRRCLRGSIHHQLIEQRIQQEKRESIETVANSSRLDNPLK